MFKALRDKSFIKALLEVFIEIFILIIIYVFLGLALPLLILFLPFIILTYIDYFFYHKQIELPILYGSIVFIFLTIFSALLMIRKYGVKDFFDILTWPNLDFTAKFGKYRKWFVYSMFFLTIITLLVLFLQAFL